MDRKSQRFFLRTLWAVSGFCASGFVVTANAEEDMTKAFEEAAMDSIRAAKKEENGKQSARSAKNQISDILRSSSVETSRIPSFARSAKREAGDEEEDDEDQKKERENWLLTGVQKLSGEYKAPEKKSGDAKRDKAFFSSDLLIDQMADYYEAKREKNKDNEESWLENSGGQELDGGDSEKDLAEVFSQENPFLNAVWSHSIVETDRGGFKEPSLRQFSLDRSFADSVTVYKQNSLTQRNPYLGTALSDSISSQIGPAQGRALSKPASSSSLLPETNTDKLSPEIRESHFKDAAKIEEKRRYRPPKKLNEQYFRNLNRF